MKEKRIDLLLIIFLILISSGLHAYYINPPVISDQLDYFFYAKTFFSEPLAISHRSLRLGLIIPAAIIIKIFGYSEAAYYAMAFIGLAALVSGTYLIALKLFSRPAAFFSALFVSIMPSVVSEAGHLLPDLPAAGFAALAFGVLASLNEVKTKAGKKTSLWLGFIAGLLLGWAYLAREFVLFIYPMAFILLWIRRRPLADYLWMVLGILCIASIEWIYCWNFYGNPLARLISAQPRGSAAEINDNFSTIITYLPRLINKYSGFTYSLLLYLGFVYNFFQSLRGRKENLFILIWFLSGYALLTLAGLFPVIMNLPDKVLLRLHLFRYWLMIMTPLVIGGVAALIEIIDRSFSKQFREEKVKKLLVSLLVVIGISFTFFQNFMYLSKNKDAVINGNDAYFEFREYIRNISNPQETLWLERDFRRASERIVPIYTRSFFGKNLWAGQIQFLNSGEQYKRISDLKEGLVVINTFFNNPSIFAYPDYLLKIPDSWSLEFISENGEVEVYRIAG